MVDATSLSAVFNLYAPKGEMDGRAFSKLAKDTKLLDKKLTSTTIDLIFAKCKGIRTMTFEQFHKALEECANKKGISVEAIQSTVCQSAAGPQYNGTKADYVKFHDDKNLYTGVYANGGPSTVDIGAGGKISDLSQLADRSSADVRGVKK